MHEIEEQTSNKVPRTNDEIAWKEQWDKRSKRKRRVINFIIGIVFGLITAAVVRMLLR